MSLNTNPAFFIEITLSYPDHKKDTYQFAAKDNQGLFTGQKMIRSVSIIIMQFLKG
ncbi:hypothetical protein BBEV_2563 [Salisediminibacterium beveridgei]|uniref:Uncharacterized protein n=1 Tax=Salisediminibacterium beveridgei TaxID=632773 RepID=A0A1D7QY21_9BACI|nr:hypothetical protein BBEV_2563 [Salisediminibacterium beveridgei]